MPVIAIGGAAAVPETLVPRPPPEIATVVASIAIRKKATSACDRDITAITWPRNSFEFSVIREDNHRDVAANPFKRKQVTHTGYS